MPPETRMTTPTPISPAPSATLADLPQVRLTPQHQSLLDHAAGLCGGPPEWRNRKIAEAHDALALAQIANRMSVAQLDLFNDLRILIQLRVPVPVLPDPRQALQIAPLAVLGIVYRFSTIGHAEPGYSFVQILAPAPVWHANVSLQLGQMLCLGPLLPAGIPLKEIILMTYGALSMQTVQLDALDPAGVLNPIAADWWQRNLNLIPLSREPFLNPQEVQS